MECVRFHTVDWKKTLTRLNACFSIRFYMSHKLIDLYSCNVYCSLGCSNEAKPDSNVYSELYLMNFVYL